MAALDPVRREILLRNQYADSEIGAITPDPDKSHPDYKIPYPNKLAEDDIAQAKKYDDAFADGVLWVTNSPDLASIYTSTFNAIGLTKSRVVVVPSVRK